MAFSGKEFWSALKTEFKVESGVLAARVTAPIGKDEKINIFGKGSLAHHKFIALNTSFKQAGLTEKQAKAAAIATTAGVIGVIDVGAVKTADAINPKFGHAMELATPLLLGSKFLNKRLMAKMFSSSGMKQAEKKFGQTAAGRETLGYASEAVGYMENHFEMYEESRQGYRDFIHANPGAHVGHGAEALEQNAKFPELVKKAAIMGRVSKAAGLSPGKEVNFHGVRLTEAEAHKHMMSMTSDQLMQGVNLFKQYGPGIASVVSSVGSSAGPGARII